MANKSGRNSDNASGRFYVDDQCIACDLCVTTAPENFKMSDDGSHAYVLKQPANPPEESLCGEAMETCPTNSIGSDGE